MNSINRFLNAESIAATARMLRSAKKEILLIVEGDDDIALFSNSLGLPRSNFISCAGKGRLMEVFDLAPRAGLDTGTIFIRDADFDELGALDKNGVALFTSDLYDFEMSLLPPRVFSRIFSEYLKTKASPENVENAFKKLLETSSFIGALRLTSHRHNLNLLFKDANFNFVNPKTLEVKTSDLVRYFVQRSDRSLKDVDHIVELMNTELAKAPSHEKICSGKDFLKILSVALAKFYKCCDSNECTVETLSRMFRVTVVHDDIKKLSIYGPLVAQIEKSGMTWRGNAL